jgi:hypothetical protein
LVQALTENRCTVVRDPDPGSGFDVVLVPARADMTSDEVRSASTALAPGGLLVAASFAPTGVPPSPGWLCSLLETAGLEIQDARAAAGAPQRALFVAGRTEGLGPVTAERFVALRRERDDTRDELHAIRQTLADLEAAYEGLQADLAATGEREARLRAAAQEASRALLERDARLGALGAERDQLAATTQELEERVADAAAKDRVLAAQRDRLTEQDGLIEAMRATRAWRAVVFWWRLRKRVAGR